MFKIGRQSSTRCPGQTEDEDRGHGQQQPVIADIKHQQDGKQSDDEDQRGDRDIENTRSEAILVFLVNGTVLTKPAIAAMEGDVSADKCNECEQQAESTIAPKVGNHPRDEREDRRRIAFALIQLHGSVGDRAFRFRKALLPTFAGAFQFLLDFLRRFFGEQAINFREGSLGDFLT